MNSQGRVSAFLFAILIGYIGVTFPAWPAHEAFKIENTHPYIYSTDQPGSQVFYMEGPVVPTLSEGWNSEIKLPRFVFRKQILKGYQPMVPVCGKIYVFSHESFTSCKSLLLFPFHGFF
jgi:hypothetical protein